MELLESYSRLNYGNIILMLYYNSQIEHLQVSKLISLIR